MFFLAYWKEIKLRSYLRSCDYRRKTDICKIIIYIFFKI